MEQSTPPDAPVTDLFVVVPREVATRIATWWRSGSLGSIDQDTREAFASLVDLARDERREKIEALAFTLFQEHRRSFKMLGGPAAWRATADDVRQAFFNMAEVALDMLEEDR